jgi:CheY-like chemotaxis protein
MAVEQSQHEGPDAAVDAVVLTANTDVRRTARFLLDSSGVRATITGDGRRAAKAMCHGVPQVLIIDRDVLRLPNIAKLSEMKQRHGALRVAVVDDPFLGDRARLAGVDVVLGWPLVRHELLNCLPKGSAYWKVRK